MRWLGSNGVRQSPLSRYSKNEITVIRSNKVSTSKRLGQRFDRQYVAAYSSVQRIHNFYGSRVGLPWDANEKRPLNALSTMSPFKCEEVAKRLDKSERYVDKKLAELVAVFPIAYRQRLLHSCDVDMLVVLLRDTEAIAKRMVSLQLALPGLDVWKMALDAPWLLDEPSVEVLAAKLPALKAELGIGMQHLVEMEPILLLIDVNALKVALFTDCIKDCQLSDLNRKNMHSAMLNHLFSFTPSLYLQSFEMPTWFPSHPYGGRAQSTSMNKNGNRQTASERKDDLLPILISRVMDAIYSLHAHHHRREIELTAQHLAKSAKVSVLIGGKVPITSIGAVVLQAVMQVVPTGELQELMLRGKQHGNSRLHQQTANNSAETMLCGEMARRLGLKASALDEARIKLFPANDKG